jgi:hypothetical protein
LHRLNETAVGALRMLLDGQPTTPAKVVFAWRIAAGDSLARATAVRWTPDGTLHVRARSDPWRTEIARAKPLILRRLAELVGPDAVVRLDVEPPHGERRPASRRPPTGS